MIFKTHQQRLFWFCGGTRNSHIVASYYIVQAINIDEQSHPTKVWMAYFLNNTEHNYLIATYNFIIVKLISTAALQSIHVYLTVITKRSFVFSALFHLRIWLWWYILLWQRPSYLVFADGSDHHMTSYTEQYPYHNTQANQQQFLQHQQTNAELVLHYW